MREARVYRLRQNILTVMNQAKPGWVTFDKLVDHPLISMSSYSRGEVFEQWHYLINQKFVNEVKDSGGEYFRISPEGENQINQEGDRDPKIWGEYGNFPR